MEYSADRPIQSIEEDKLGRSSFSQHLGRTICEYKGEDSLVIGLYGGWGTGKTSILNMVVQELDICSVGDACKPIVVKFNPWLYSSQANLIDQFFNCLKSAIGKDSSEGIKKVGRMLEDYSGVFEAVTALSQFSVFAPLVKNVAHATGELLQKPADLESSKEKLEQALREEKRKIVVVIDDIDRLNNSQIKDIFQLVKQVGSLPYVIYILSMDRNVVQRALKEVHNCDGNEYLDKIVQIPFEIPVLNRIKLQRIFVSKFYDAIREISNHIQLEKDYLDYIITYCVDPYIHTLRDINRIINSFKFRYSMLHDETSCEDMIGVTTLEVMEPKLYQWISLNKNDVCGGAGHVLSSSTKGKKEEYREKFVGIFNELGIESEKAIKCLAAMFPAFADDTCEHYQYYSVHEFSARGQMRIAQPERFDLYFMLNLTDVPISRYAINSCIYELDEEKLAKTIRKINDDGKILYFLNELQALVDKVPYDRINMISKVLLYTQYEFIGKEEYGLYIMSPYHLSSYYVADIIKRLNTMDERYDTYSQVISGASIRSLGAIAYAINILELAYGRLASNHEEKAGQIISLNQLQKLENKFVDKIIKLSSVEKLIEAEDFDMCFYLWSCLDKESSNTYITEGFKDDIFKLKFVCRMAKIFSGSNGNGWHYDSSMYHEYIYDEEIYDLIMRRIKADIKEYNELELIKLASFVLSYNNPSNKYVSDNEAKKLVAEWKNKQ